MQNVYYVEVTPGNGVTYIKRSSHDEASDENIPTPYFVNGIFRCWVRAYNTEQARTAAQVSLIEELT